jgi:hypothetical protein
MSPTSIKIQWQNPYSGTVSGTDISGYRVKDGSGRQVCQVNGSTTSCTDSNLKAGNYSYQAQAYNSYGSGPWSTSTPAITIDGLPLNTSALTAGASSEPNYLMVTTTGAGGVQAPTNLTTGSEPIDPGSSFTIRAHLMAAPGTKVSGSMGLKFGSVNGTAVSPQLEEGDSPNFSVDDTWTQVAATFVLNGTTSATSFTPTFSLNVAGGVFAFLEFKDLRFKFPKDC